MTSTEDARLPRNVVCAVILSAIFGFLLELELKRGVPSYLLIAVLAVLTVLPLLRASRLEDQARRSL